MQYPLIYPVGSTLACRHAAQLLAKNGIAITDHPTPDVTCLLMDVPSFTSDGLLRSGVELASLLPSLPEKIALIGGNIPDCWHKKYKTMDLLREEFYLMENAAITAECALMLVASKMQRTYCRSRVLIIGWGRIGKHLAYRLKALGAELAVASRNDAHRAEILSLGIKPVKMEDLPEATLHCQILFNTAPQLSVPSSLAAKNPECLKIDLASQTGIEGTDVICARGLPGKFASISSGELIASTILRRWKEVIE